MTPKPRLTTLNIPRAKMTRRRRDPRLMVTGVSTINSTDVNCIYHVYRQSILLIHKAVPHVLLIPGRPLYTIATIVSTLGTAVRKSAALRRRID